MRILRRLFGRGRSAGGEDRKNTGEKPPSPLFYELGDGYALAYEQKKNGLGGYADVNVRLYRGNVLIRRMTDQSGRFLNFPGVEHGKWEKELTSPFCAVTRYTVGYNRFGEDGLAELIWLVQPDGRYDADEDGFGMEDDVEIRLCAKFDRTGRFVTPFRIVSP